MDRLIGKMLGNRYEVLEKIGEGGMAVVYKAKCHLLNRFVAIKVLKEEFVNDEEFNLKFQNEAMSAGGLNQQNIIAVYDVGEDEGYPYIVMEYVDGGNIKDIIHRQGKLPIDDVINYTRQIGYALREAHQNKIVHRDIKPQNIMITKNNMVKVADFGIAKAVTSSTITAVGTIMGSVHYFSPEQARGGYIDERSDIYSLGIVMYEMATGKLPFDGDSPVNIALKHIQEEIKFDDNDDIPTEIKEIIRKATQKSPDRRYKNIDALLDDLDYVQNSKTLALGMGFEDETYRTQVINVDENDEYQQILFNDVASASEKSKPKKRRQAPRRSTSTEEQLERHRREEEPVKKSSVALVALGALITALVFLGAVFLIRGGTFGGGNEKIETPSFVGMTVEEAREHEDVKKYNLVIVEFATEKNANYEPGQITEQDPTAGTKIEQGSEINVTVVEEEPEEPIDMPEVKGMLYEDAKKLLEALGIQVIPSYKADTEEKDKVIEQSMPKDFKVEKGDPVTLTVSLGPDGTVVIVPNVVGSDLETAKRDLEKVGLTSSTSFDEDHSKTEGTVLLQTPKAGSEVTKNSSIALVINRYETPKQTEVTIFLNGLPEDRPSLRVEVVDDETGKSVYDKVVDPAIIEGSLEVVVKGDPGTIKTYSVYFDADRTTPFTSRTIDF